MGASFASMYCIIVESAVNTCLLLLVCVQAEPLLGKVGKILTWRWVETEEVEKEQKEEEPSASTSTAPVKKRGIKRFREFFVKWHEMSYWHCSWVSELQVCMSQSYRRC